ncbi:MAG: tetratricopeptide repeat protein, partial [Acidobacteria bacterium]|nr:tetratricopeptide repeat protein [Acidobacteriota bacterium]
GLPLDQRSDLFSLGLVLYEAATGSNPFAAENPLAALRRIAKEEEPSLSPQRPDLPPVLLSAVHRLLAKSRELRPQSAGELLRDLEGLDPVSAGTETVFGIEAVAWEPESRMEPPRRASSDAALSSATEQLPGSSTPPAPSRKRSSGLRRTGAVALLAGLLLLAAFLLRRPAREPAASLVLAVPLPRVVEGLSGEQLELVPGAVRFAVLSAMTELEGVSALAAAEVDTASGSPSEVARTTRADEVLDSELDCRAQRCWVTLSRLADGGQRLVWTERLEVPADNLYLVAQAVAGFLRQGFPELRRRPGPPPLEARPRDYEEFLRLERDFRQKAGGLGEEVILSRLKSIRESSPRFLEAYLLAAEIRRLRFVQTRKEEDLDRAFSLVEETRRLAPRSPRPLYFLFNAALVGGRLDLAEATLRELEALDPGAVQLDTLRAHLLEARGEGRAALVEMRRATERRPSVLNLSNLAEKEFLLGETPESRRHLLQALELSPKDHTLHSRLASLELMAGDPARAVELYSALAERNPGFAELSNLGLALLLESRFGEARDRFRQALELAPRNVFALLNLADAEWLSGGEAGALELYRRLLQAIEEDPAAVGWQFLTVKAQALAHLGRGAEALEAIAEAQRRAPDNPQVAYESALVLTLTGDLDTARTQAMRALDQGYDARWFSFPWFDSLRQDPEVLRRLNKETEKPPP